ncbi:MFS transporter [Halobacillus campisalis]|uniref:MFS transporter n=1 Tax=Halobacillus campisalis TaxID=435909 RepID=A0ABW2K145_9BACI|nr:MFS transporter [Halobacillus campisalis]
MITNARHQDVQRPSEWKKNYPAFRFIGGNVISFFGDQIYLLALPLIVFALTGSPLAMGVIAFLERLPILLQPLLGAAVDRLDRKRILLYCDAVRGVTAGLVGGLFIIDQLMLWQLFGSALVMGFFTQLYNTSQFASIPSLVREIDLERANSINTGLFQTAVMLGPAAGGLIVSLYHPGYALLINSLSFFLAWIAVKTLPLIHTNIRESKQRLWQDVKEGFVYVYQIKPILYTNLAMMVSIFGTTLFLTMMVFHLKGTVELTASEIGVLLSVGGGAAIIGALITPALRKRWSYQRILFTASSFGGLSIIGFSMTSSFSGLMMMNAAGTFAASVQSPCIVTVRQKLTPQRLLGRVQATSRLISWVSMPAAALLAGLIAEWFSTTYTILLGGIVATAASVFYLHPSLSRVFVRKM